MDTRAAINKVAHYSQSKAEAMTSCTMTMRRDGCCNAALINQAADCKLDQREYNAANNEQIPIYIETHMATMQC